MKCQNREYRCNLRLFYVSVAVFYYFAANLNKTAIKARNLLERKENYSNENKNH